MCCIMHETKLRDSFLLERLCVGLSRGGQPRVYDSHSITHIFTQVTTDTERCVGTLWALCGEWSTS